MAKVTKVKVKEPPPPIPIAEMQRCIRTAGGKVGKVWRYFENPDGSLEVLYSEPIKRGRREAASALIFDGGYTSLSDGW